MSMSMVHMVTGKQTSGKDNTKKVTVPTTIFLRFQVSVAYFAHCFQIL